MSSLKLLFSKTFLKFTRTNQVLLLFSLLNLEPKLFGSESDSVFFAQALEAMQVVQYLASCGGTGCGPASPPKAPPKLYNSPPPDRYPWNGPFDFETEVEGFINEHPECDESLIDSVTDTSDSFIDSCAVPIYSKRVTNWNKRVVFDTRYMEGWRWDKGYPADVVTPKLRNTVAYREFGDFMAKSSHLTSSVGGLGSDLDAFNLLKQCCYNREIHQDSGYSLENPRKLQIVKASFHASLELLRLKSKRSLIALAYFSDKFWTTNMGDFKKVWSNSLLDHGQRFKYAGCRLIDWRKEPNNAEPPVDCQGNLEYNNDKMAAKYEFAEEVYSTSTNYSKTHISPRSARIAEIFMDDKGHGSYEFRPEDEGMLLYSGLGYIHGYVPTPFESWDERGLHAPIVKLKSHSRCAYPGNIFSFGDAELDASLSLKSRLLSAASDNPIVRRFRSSGSSRAMSAIEVAYSQSVLELPVLQSTSTDPRVALGGDFTGNLGPFVVYRMCTGLGGSGGISTASDESGVSDSVPPRGIWVEGAKNNIGVMFEEFEFLLPPGIQYIKTGEIYAYTEVDDEAKRLEMYEKLGLLNDNLEQIAEEVDFSAENNPQTAKWDRLKDGCDTGKCKSTYFHWEKSIVDRYGGFSVLRRRKSAARISSEEDSVIKTKLKNLNRLLVRVTSEQAKQKFKEVVAPIAEIESEESETTKPKPKSKPNVPPKSDYSLSTNSKWVLVGIQLDIVGWNRGKFEHVWKVRQGIPESIPENQAIAANTSGFTSDYWSEKRREWKWITFDSGIKEEIDRRIEEKGNKK